MTRVAFLDCDGVLACCRSVLLNFDDDDPTLVFDREVRAGRLEFNLLRNVVRLRGMLERSTVL